MGPKHTILNAAQAVFARHGYRQTSMAMVADEANLTRQALYHHFASKEALFAALVDLIHQAARSASRAVAPDISRASPAEIVSAMIWSRHEALMARVAGSPYAAELMEESSRQCGPAVADYMREHEQDIVHVLTKLARAGRLNLKPGLTAKSLAETVSHAARGVKAAHLDQSEAQHRRALCQIVDLIFAGAETSARRNARSKTATAPHARRRRVAP